MLTDEQAFRETLREHVQAGAWAEWSDCRLVFADWLEERGRWAEAMVSRAEWNPWTKSKVPWSGNQINTHPGPYEPLKVNSGCFGYDVLVPYHSMPTVRFPKPIATVLTEPLLHFAPRTLLMGYRLSHLNKDIIRIYHRWHNPFRTEAKKVRAGEHLYVRRGRRRFPVGVAMTSGYLNEISVSTGRGEMTNITAAIGLYGINNPTPYKTCTLADLCREWFGIYDKGD